MDKYAVIVAGGEGTRAGGDLPKQLHPVNGMPLLWWTMKAFRDEDPSTRLIVVMNPRVRELWERMCAETPDGKRIPHQLTDGGATRSESVVRGLALVPDRTDALVAVHDAARATVPAGVIAAAWESAALTGSGVPAVAVTDSLRKVGPEGNRAVDRKDFRAVQTPQTFRADLLKEAYARQPGADLSDDATVYEKAGHKVTLTPGSPLNIKVTNPGDFETAARILSGR